jgi:Undecaprenyl-phosphate glucose phosphotransferase
MAASTAQVAAASPTTTVRKPVRPRASEMRWPAIEEIVGNAGGADHTAGRPAAATRLRRDGARRGLGPRRLTTPLPGLGQSRSNSRVSNNARRLAAIYGAGQPCAGLLNALETGPDSDIKICGVFDDRGEHRAQESVAGCPKLGNLEALIRYCRSMHIDLLIVALPLSAERRVLEIIKKLWVLPVDIRLAAQTSTLRFRPRAYSFVGNVPVLDIIDKPITDWNVVIKRVFDIVGAALASIALAPVMALVALAIKLDSPGPVLFRQERYGFNNELIEVFKFRSMYADKADAGARQLVSKHDVRVTTVGRLIRKTSLDELPQLFNVLRGELSLVGPRPHALQAKAANELYHDVVDGYFARHKVKPGITGWAQVNGWRGETDTPEKIHKRVEHDLYYIDNWSVLFDLYILLRTPLALLSAKNAY